MKTTRNNMFGSPWHLLPLCLVLVVAAGLFGCGGGGGGGGGTDTQVPIAEILFPPAVSLTEADRVTVRGTASDNGVIAVVRVNGIDATGTDGFATWQASVPLVLGQNTLTVEATDMASNVNPAAAEALIDRSALWINPQAIALDRVNNRALVADPVLDAVVAVDLANGARVMFSK